MFFGVQTKSEMALRLAIHYEIAFVGNCIRPEDVYETSISCPEGS